MFWAEDVPVWESSGDDDVGGGGKVNVSVWAGNYFGLSNVRKSPPPDSWASDPENDVAILHIVISPGGEPILPRANSDGVNRSLYLIEGHTNGVKVDGRAISERAFL